MMEKLYLYDNFQRTLNTIIEKVCRGELKAELKIPPGFYQDIDKGGILVPSVSLKNGIYDLTSFTGAPSLSFDCKATTWATAQPLPSTPVAAPATPLSVQSFGTPRPGQCTALVPIQTSLATKSQSTFTGVVLNNLVADALKAFPLCFDVLGYAFVAPGQPYMIYNIADLQTKLQQRLRPTDKIPGFTVGPTKVEIYWPSMFGSSALGFWHLNPPQIGASVWKGGRRTRKRKNTGKPPSKKFTQRKR